MTHATWGESPHAFVVLRPGKTATEEELREFVRGMLACSQAPSAVDFIAELPNTATGKIQKYILRGGRFAMLQ